MHRLLLRRRQCHEGLSDAEARARIFVLDSRGLLRADADQPDFKQEFAQDPAVFEGWSFEGRSPALADVVREAGITALLGLSGQPGAFDEALVRQVAEHTDRPIVFALSNPTKLCEALPADVLAWTDGKALVATGSPFDPVEIGGRTIPIGQGNNAYVFPGIGFGAMVAEASQITDAMVAEAAYAVAEHTLAAHGDGELIYPPLGELKIVSRKVAAAVVRQAQADGVARADLPEDIEAYVATRAWTPTYLPVHHKTRDELVQERAR